MKQHTSLQRSLRSILALSLSALSISMPVTADSGSLPITQVISPGSLTLQASDHAELSPVILSHTQGRTSTGVLTQATIDDSRGIAAGWSATATVSNLVSYGTFTDENGQPGPFTVHGTYAGNDDTDFTITLGNANSGPGLGQIGYELTQSSITTNSILLPTQLLGSSGLSFDAPDITYERWSVYHLHIHVIPATGLTITPTAITTLAGQSDQVVGGTAHTLSSVNDPVMLATAGIGSGEGLYQIGADLQLAIPSGTHPGIYNGVIIETIN